MTSAQCESTNHKKLNQNRGLGWPRLNSFLEKRNRADVTMTMLGPLQHSLKYEYLYHWAEMVFLLSFQGPSYAFCEWCWFPYPNQRRHIIVNIERRTAVWLWKLYSVQCEAEQGLSNGVSISNIGLSWTALLWVLLSTANAYYAVRTCEVLLISSYISIFWWWKYPTRIREYI